MDMVKELVGLFIEANHRLLRIVRERVGIENLFHAPDKVRAYLGDTPTLNLPRGQASSWASVLPKKV